MVNLPTAASPVGDSQGATAPTPTAVSAVAPEAAVPSVVQAKPSTVPPEPTITEVKQAAKQLETFMQSMNRYLEFRIDQDSGRTIVTVKDKTTGDVVRQIPAEEVLRLAQNLGGKAHTALVSQTA
jgi:flagellar protein FlaG